jgi:ubiquitin-protein ligase
MSIRNKRLIKEQYQLDNFELDWPVDWTHHETVIIKTVQKDKYITIEVGMKYPFTPPRLYINQNKKIDYIDWFVSLKRKYKDFTHLIEIPCVCCNNKMCNWAPTYGVRTILNEYLDFESFLHPHYQ